MVVPVFESLYYENGDDFEEGLEISNEPESDVKAGLGGEFSKNGVNSTGYGNMVKW